MLSLAAQLGQTVQLGIWKNGCLIYIDQAFSSAPLSIIAPLYEPVQINTSASAKIMLSLLPDAECQNALTTCKFHRLTDNTITDKTAFMEEIKKSRFCGYGYDDEEFAVGIGCLAVPIYDGQKNVLVLLESQALSRSIVIKRSLNTCFLSFMTPLPKLHKILFNKLSFTPY